MSGGVRFFSPYACELMLSLCAPARSTMEDEGRLRIHDKRRHMGVRAERYVMCRQRVLGGCDFKFENLR